MRTLSLTLLLLPTLCLAADGLSLTAAQDLARSKNPLIPAAAAKLAAARANAAMTNADFAPQLTANAVGARGQGSMMFSPSAMGIDFQHAPEEGIVAGGLMLEWQLFSFGRSDSIRQGASRAVTAAEAELNIVKLDVMFELRSEFAMGLQLQDLMDGWTAQVDAAKELERITNENYDAGKVPQAYTFRAKADRLRAERELAKAGAELQGALAGVAVCCGADITDNRLGDWDVEMSAPNTFDEAADIALKNAPEIKQFEAEISEFKFRERAARQSSLPELSFSAMADSLSRDTFGSRSGSSIALLLSAPLFDGGARNAAASEARNNRIAAESKLTNAKNQVRKNVVSAWAKWTASSTVLESGTAEFAAASEAFRIAKIRYEEGKSIQAEVSQALADMQMARASLAESSQYRRMAWSSLQRAMGTGY